MNFSGQYFDPLSQFLQNFSDLIVLVNKFNDLFCLFQCKTLLFLHLICNFLPVQSICL